MAGIPEPAAGAEARTGRQATAAAPARRRPGPAATILQGASEERRAVVPRTGAQPRHADAARRAVNSDRAALGRRLGALVYEALLLVAMALIVGFLFLPLVSS